MTVHVIDESELPVIVAMLDYMDQLSHWSTMEHDFYYKILLPAVLHLTGSEWKPLTGPPKEIK